MPKLIILQGLPSSGKSSFAQEYLKKDGNAVRINKDSLRTMLHFDVWSGQREEKTRIAARALAKTFLNKKMNVLIDDTNLNQHTLESWKQAGKEWSAKVEIIKIDTPIEECIRRDELREKKVGKSVIIGMAMANNLYHEPIKGYVIADIDGTVANIDHRLKYVAGEKKDWKMFFDAMGNDLGRWDTINNLNTLFNLGYEIFFVSGRPDNYRKQTEKWLSFRIPFEYKSLFMRRAGDHREDYIVKSEIFKNYFKNPDLVHYVYDDRPQVILKCWNVLVGKEKVVDVGNNKYFTEERKELNYYTP